MLDCEEQNSGTCEERCGGWPSLCVRYFCPYFAAARAHRIASGDTSLSIGKPSRGAHQWELCLHLELVEWGDVSEVVQGRRFFFQPSRRGSGRAPFGIEVLAVGCPARAFRWAPLLLTSARSLSLRFLCSHPPFPLARIGSVRALLSSFPG